MIAAQQPLPGISWFDLDDPPSPALDELAKQFELHELQVEDCRHRPQRAKTDEFEHYIFSVLKFLPQKDKAVFEDLDIFLGPNFLITVHPGTCALVEKLKQSAAQFRLDRLDRIFYRLVDLVVDEYQILLDEVADRVSDIESEVLSCPEPPVLQRIFALKRELIEFRRVVAGMREVVNTLMRREGGLLGDDLDPYFRDIYDHLVRTLDLIETYRDLLTGSLDIYLSAVANRTNEVVKVLTIWGTVALPLLIITGFYGMNLPLPWAQRAHSTVFVTLLMLATTAAVLAYFRRKRWF
jgi:magnesium transporter